MPKDKDLKNLVRARMAKTGESYSIARLRIAGDGNPPSKLVAVGNQKSVETHAAPAIYQVKISISEIAPSIWRRLQVPADASLAQLHDVIQAAFGWWNCHLHQYIVDGHFFGVPDPEYADEMPPMKDERDTTLREILGAATIIYEYDFGDSWKHLIEIESVAVAPQPGTVYPICTAGERARPPEDCGGVSGYEDLLEILADPEHEEYQQMKTWVGKKFAPEKFDLLATNRALQKYAGDRDVPGRAVRMESRPSIEGAGRHPSASRYGRMNA
jgi:hypothetical protein